MAVRLQIRNDVATAWYQANPILAIGELAIERDTRQFKIGDGSTRWQSLPYVTQGQTGKSIEFDWDDTKLGIRAEGAAEFVYVELEGKKGEQGDSLEFTWNGTKLGVRVKGTIEYIYTDLEANIRSEFQSNEALRQSNYLSSEADRNAAYLDAEDVRDAEFQSKEVIRNTDESQRNADEILRKSQEQSRVIAENNRNFFEDYDPTHSYQNGNKVAYNGSTYTAIAPSKNVEPGTNSLIWKLSAKKGETGSISDLNATHIEDALGYVPADAENEHTHTNKSIIDKFTEVDNKPYYNGEEIGGAVPNLTLSELTLGGRFKIVYNDIEDSLDIEVI
ncbi:MAG: hypothetical protein GX787_08115 [Tissierellia bacterium]|nr:hypothetical protein [Tissierellia bacterium]